MMGPPMARLDARTRLDARMGPPNLQRIPAERPGGAARRRRRGGVTCAQLCAMARRRIGRHAPRARIAAPILSAAATMNTAFHVPVAAFSTLACATSSAAVPFAAYGTPD